MPRTNMIFRFAVIPCTITGLFAAPHARAAVKTTTPFVGTYSDSFNYPTPDARLTLQVLQNHATINMISPDGAIKLEFSSLFQGKQVRPRSGSTFAGQLGIADWVFTTPMAKFGCYFENNSGANDGIVEFFSASDAPLGSLPLKVSFTTRGWQWNGWTSDVPLGRIRITGNGLVNGFIWYDDAQATPAVPGSWTLAPAAVALLARRRRRS